MQGILAELALSRLKMRGVARGERDLLLPR